MITLGNEDNITLKVGTETVVAVYMGTEQVYPDTPPTPPGYDFGERYYYTDSTYYDNNNITDGTLEEVNSNIMQGKTCSALTVGERVTEIMNLYDSVGDWSSLETLTITENVAAINYMEFLTYTPTIVFLGTTPPVIDYCSLDVDIDVIVPQGRSGAYRTVLNRHFGTGRFIITEA